MAAVERQRATSRAPRGLNVWELYHRGLWHFYQFQPDQNRLALKCLHNAAVQDRSNAAVYGALALAYFLGGRLFAPEDRVRWVSPFLENGRTAVQLDPSDAEAHALLGNALLSVGEHEAAVKETAQAIALNPNNSLVQGLHGFVLTYAGQPATALAHLEQVIRLSPLDPLRWLWINALSIAQYLVGDYEACAATGEDSSRLHPDAPWCYRSILVASAELGRVEEVRHYAGVLFRRFHGEIRGFLTTRWPEWRAVDYDAFVASLTKSGLALRDGVLVLDN